LGLFTIVGFAALCEFCFSGETNENGVEQLFRVDLKTHNSLRRFDVWVVEVNNKILTLLFQEPLRAKLPEGAPFSRHCLSST
jgi:hypothetical protein